MTRFRKSLISTTLAGLIASPAAADISAEDLYNTWTEKAAEIGLRVTIGEEDISRKGVELENVEIVLPLPEGAVSYELGMLNLLEQRDGSVIIETSPESIFRISGRTETGEDVDIDLKLIYTGHEQVLSEDGPNTVFDFSAESAQIVLDRLTINGVPLEGVVDATLTGLKGQGSYNFSEDGEMLNFAASSVTKAISYLIDFDIPEEDVRIEARVLGADLSSAVSGSFPMNITAEDWEDGSALFAAGLGYSAQSEMSALSFDVDARGDGQEFALRGAAGSATSDVTFGPEVMDYDTAINGLTVEVSGSEIPFPQMTFSMAEYGLGFAMPVVKSDTPGDVGMKVTLRELTLPEEIWMMGDPGGMLPHDPLTAIVDVAGKMNWLIDIMDPTAQAAADAAGEIPAELHAMDLNALQLNVAGAELLGSGAFTFDNSDLVSFDGMPRPEGKLNLSLTGGNGLLDTLIAMGYVQEQDAMGARMMLGMFARPGEGPDTLTSEIEVTADGQVLANGQRIK